MAAAKSSNPSAVIPAPPPIEYSTYRSAVASDASGGSCIRGSPVAIPRPRANACASAGSIWLWQELQPPFLTNVGLVFSSRSSPFFTADFNAAGDGSSFATTAGPNSETATRVNARRMVILLRLLPRTGGMSRRFPQQARQRVVASSRRDARGGLALGGHVGVGAISQQQANDVWRVAVVLRRVHQRRVAAIVGRVDVRAFGEQELDRLVVAAVRRSGQRRLATL